MSISTNMIIQIDSNRCGKTFNASRFTEYGVDLDLETDADVFDFVTKNPDGLYTGLFCKFDNCRLMLNGKVIMTGILDSVTYIETDDDDYIKFTGRDLCWKLVDNDALPDTLENVLPKTYITQKCKDYGIKCSPVVSDVYPSLVIGCGESEISIMNNILLNSKHRIWYEVDTIYTGYWSTGKTPIHVFSKSNSVNGIPIKKIELIEDGTDMKSEVRLYGADDDGNQKVVGISRNTFMVSRGINKRRIRRQYSDSAASKYTSIADKDIRDSFRDNIVMKLTVRMDGINVYMPNTTAQVVHDKLGINALMFIKAVKYMKSISGGSEAILSMMPADTTFEMMWQSTTNISITNLTAKSKTLIK